MRHPRPSKSAFGGYPPEFVSKQEVAYILGSVVIVKRAMHAGKLVIVRQGGRGCSTLIDYRSVLKVAAFMRRGGQFPRLPSENGGYDSSN